LVWDSGPQPADNASGFSLSLQHLYLGDGINVETFSAGTSQLHWDGKGSDGRYLGTGDYQVKLVITQAGTGNQVYSKTLTVVLQADKTLSLAKLGPNPAVDQVSIDLSALPNGTPVEVSLWNMAGELIKRSTVVSGTQAVVWALNSSSGQVLADGIYLLQLRTIPSDARLQDRRVIKLAVIRK
jgi:hypothetical protein